MNKESKICAGRWNSTEFCFLYFFKWSHDTEILQTIFTCAVVQKGLLLLHAVIDSWVDRQQNIWIFSAHTHHSSTNSIHRLWKLYNFCSLTSKQVTCPFCVFIKLIDELDQMPVMSHLACKLLQFLDFLVDFNNEQFL